MSLDRHLSILVVDDDPDNLALTETILALQGHEVCHATSAAAGRRAS